MKLTSSDAESSTSTIRQHLKRCIAPEKKRLNFALLFATLSVAVFVVQSALLAHLMGGLLQGSAIASVSLLNYLLGLILCLIARPILQFIRERLSQTASHHARITLRQQLLQTLSKLGPERQTIAADGALSTRLLEQVDALDGYISRYYVQLYLVLLTPVILLASTAYYSLFAAALLLVTAPLVPLFMILVGGAAAKSSQQQMAAMSQLSSRFLDFVRGMPSLIHLQATDQAQSSVSQASEQYRIKTMSVLKLAFLSGAVLELFSALAVALVAVYLGIGLLGMLPWAKGEIPVAYTGALFILLLAPEFYAPLRQLGSDYHAKAEAEGAIEELLPLLEQTAWQHPGNSVISINQAPSISIQQVQVTGLNQRQRLQPVSLMIQAGERVLLQGESGSGKSTLLTALMGFVPYSGEVLINQQNFKEINVVGWLQAIGYLSQQPQFKQASIAENLKLANSQATEQQLWHVLEQVGLATVIQQLPQRLDTRLGERGTGLSGGQLGRLAVAQLLLRQPEVWLLDEPTAHLDPETQLQINQLLAQVTEGKTVLLVSHNQHGLQWVDRVINLSSIAQEAVV